MLISLRHRFIFVANPKTASTSIEETLKPYSEIALNHAAFGKHLPLADIVQRFSWIFSYVDRRDFTIFSVIRDPIDQLFSLYRSHMKDEFRGTDLDTSRYSFTNFVEIWLPQHADQWAPQWSRFASLDKDFDLDVLLDFEHLAATWPRLLDRLALPYSPLGVFNASPTVCQALDAEPLLVERLRRARAEDVKLIETVAWR